MLRSLHPHSATTSLRHNLKLCRTSRCAVNRGFHASVKRQFSPIDVLELFHSHLPYLTAIPLLAAFTHLLRYFLVDKRHVTRELEAAQRTGPFLRAWSVGRKRLEVSSSLKNRDSRTATVEEQSPDTELDSRLVKRLEREYGLPPRKRLRPLLITTVLHCSWTLTAFIQMAGGSLSHNMGLEIWGFAGKLDAGPGVPSIEEIETAIEALYSPGSNLPLISLIGVTFGLVYLRNPTFLTAFREGDMKAFPLLARLIDPFNKPAVFLPLPLSTGAVAYVPQWLVHYNNYVDFSRDTIRTYWRKRYSAESVPSPTLDPETGPLSKAYETYQDILYVLVLPAIALFSKEVLVQTCSPAQVVFLSACGVSAWLRADSLRRHELSQRANFKDQGRSWQPLVPKGRM